MKTPPYDRVQELASMLRSRFIFPHELDEVAALLERLRDQRDEFKRRLIELGEKAL